MDNPLQFWLSYNNGAERIRLPVNPDKIEVDFGHGFNDVDVVNLGEVTIPGNAMLKGFNLSSFFPRDYNPSYCEFTDIPNPWDMVERIERWVSTRRPIRLTVTGTPINYPVTVRSFKYDEHGGEPGDIYFSLTLKEFKFLTFRTISTPATAAAAPTAPAAPSSVIASQPARPDNRPEVGQYTIASGDTLWGIAQTTLGDGDRWREIYDLNVSVIGANSNNLNVGDRLVIPTKYSAPSPESQPAQAKAYPGKPAYLVN